MVLLLSLHFPSGYHCSQRRLFQLCPCISSYPLQRLLVGVGLCWEAVFIKWEALNVWKLEILKREVIPNGKSDQETCQNSKRAPFTYRATAIRSDSNSTHHGWSPGKWEEYRALPLALSQYSVCQSLWIFPFDSEIVDAGVQFVQVSKAAAQHSRGCMARRNVRYLVQTISNGAPWLSHFPRTLQAGINKLLSEDKPPLETSADLFQKSELLYSYRLDFRRVRSHFSLHARNHPVHQHVDWALLVPSSGGLLIANSFEITRSFGFFLDCWDEQCLDLSCWPDACSTTPRDWEKRCSSVAVLTSCSCWFLLFPFRDRAMTSEVRHERACTSFWTRVYCSKLSADREPEENEMYGHLRW